MTDFYLLQGAPYVPVLQTEAVVRLLKRLLSFFKVFIEILYFSNRKNIFLPNFFNRGLHHDLQYHLTIDSTCPQHFGVQGNLEAAIEADSLRNGGTIPLKVLKTPHTPWT